MIDINAAFDNCSKNQCLESEPAEQFEVIDNEEGRSVIYKGDFESIAHPFLTVKNCTKKELYFLAIDHCIFSDADGKKCDCAIFNEEKFCFVELKKAGSTKSRSKRKIEAVEKFIEMIPIFLEKLDFSNYAIEAVLCVGFKKSIPTAKSSMLYYEKLFLDEFNVYLKEGTIIEFSQLATNI